MKRLSALLLAAGMLFSPAVLANINVEHIYARATPPNITTSAVFMQIHNQGEQALSLVAADSPSAGHIELHTMVMEQEVMKMRQVEKIDLAANSMTQLKPGGLHVMLFDLKQPLVEGEKIDISLHFSDGSQQQFSAPIKKVKAMMKH